MEYTRTTSGTILSADVWISGGQVIFQYKTWYIHLEAFASKNLQLFQYMQYHFKSINMIHRKQK